jgi:hypothetical protein
MSRRPPGHSGHRWVRRRRKDSDAEAARDEAMMQVLNGADLEPEDDVLDALEISRLRFQVSLAVLPYVGQYLEYTLDRALVVDDVAGQYLDWHQDGGHWEEFWPAYVARIEQGAGCAVADSEGKAAVAKGRSLEQEWVWANHALTLRQTRGVA